MSAAQRLARLGVEGVEELVEVDRGRRVGLVDDAAGGDRLLVVGRRELEVDVAIGHAGERGLADDRLRAAAQRAIARVGDLHPHVGLAVGRQVDALDLADGDAGHLHEVALDELRGVLKARVDGVGAAAVAEQERRPRPASAATSAAAARTRRQGVGRRQAGLQKRRPPRPARCLSWQPPTRPRAKTCAFRRAGAPRRRRRIDPFDAHDLVARLGSAHDADRATGRRRRGRRSGGRARRWRGRRRAAR